MENPTPRFGALPVWMLVSGMSRTCTYRELGKGNLKAVKYGKRLLIDIEHGLAWMRSLPPAQIRPANPQEANAAA